MFSVLLAYTCVNLLFARPFFENMTHLNKITHILLCFISSGCVVLLHLFSLRLAVACVLVQISQEGGCTSLKVIIWTIVFIIINFEDSGHLSLKSSMLLLFLRLIYPEPGSTCSFKVFTNKKEVSSRLLWYRQLRMTKKLDVTHFVMVGYKHVLHCPKAGEQFHVHCSFTLGWGDLKHFKDSPQFHFYYRLVISLSFAMFTVSVLFLAACQNTFPNFLIMKSR